MAEVIHMFPWAWVRKCELREKPMCPEEILARLLADMTEAHRLMLEMVSLRERTFGEEDERQKKACKAIFQATKQVQNLMLILVESGFVDLEAVLEAWKRFGPNPKRRI